ncbi:mitochondrial inner membrane protease subunit 1-like isoform X2 [Lingula anatina]|uniref:Mitochondrial inner membrane protease subunit 1-like isoform X2 n=1 Tax=Lingula anatina TaxID=7574 RepID=A0A1S3HZN1_LINAN|nr:mitochondrial inner membrane protease subunit 1-like isoform X2 [Lingula anatina]|eukprot:XP_013391472.1 mitochondrial inner membrane protease subunit 1-like isoform X2 [Lingula anatina]
MAFRRGVRLAGRLLKYGAIIHCTAEFVGHITVCHGSSMEPTIKGGDVVIVEKISINFQNIERGDVVLCRSPVDPRTLVMKRVTLIEGDVLDKTSTSPFLAKVPTGHVWLEGDNTEQSKDSNDYGPVPYGLLQGKVLLKVFPINRFGLLKDKCLD